MSYMTQQLKDAAHTGHPAITTTKSNIEKNPQYPTKTCCPTHSDAISLFERLVFSTSSGYVT